MNKKIGMYASILTLAGVIGFSISMIIDFDIGNYISSMFIALGICTNDLCTYFICWK